VSTTQIHVIEPPFLLTFTPRHGVVVARIVNFNEEA